MTSSIENDLLLKLSLFSRPFISPPLATSRSFVEVSESHDSYGNHSANQEGFFFFLQPTGTFNVDHGDVTLTGSAPIYSQWVTHINSARK